MSERQLSWQLGFSLSRKPAKRPAPRRNTQQGFEFVMEHPQRSYRRARRSSVETARKHAEPPSSGNSSRERGHSIVASTHKTHYQSGVVEEEDHQKPPVGADPSSLEILDNESSLSSEASPDQDTIDGTNEACSSPCQAEGQAVGQAEGQASRSLEHTVAEEHTVDGSSPDAGAMTASVSYVCPQSPPLPPTMEYINLTERFRPILTRCNAFC